MSSSHKRFSRCWQRDTPNGIAHVRSDWLGCQVTAAVGGAGTPSLSPCPATTRLPAGAGGDYASGLGGDPMGIALIWGLALILTRGITSKVDCFTVPFASLGCQSPERKRVYSNFGSTCFSFFQIQSVLENVICRLRLRFLRVCR